MFINYDFAPYLAAPGLIFFYSTIISNFLLLVIIRLSKKKYNNSKLNTLMYSIMTLLISLTHILVGAFILENHLSSAIIALSSFGFIVIIVLILVLKHDQNIFHLNRPKKGNYNTLYSITSNSLTPDITISGKFSNTSGIITFNDNFQPKNIELLDEIAENDMITVSRNSLENMLIVYFYIILIILSEYMNLSIFFYTFIK